MTEIFRERLLNREKLLGTLMSLPSPEVAEVLAGAGFDWLFLDMEHGFLEVLAVQRIVQVVGQKVACVVRVPSHDPVWIKKILDIGVAGILVPQVNTPEQALAIAQQTKYPPRGTRSVGVSRAHGYGAGFERYMGEANDVTAVITQAEHIEAVHQIDAILETPDLDAVLVGPFDLSASMGKPGRIGDEDLQAAIKKVREASIARKKPVGIFAPDLERARTAFEVGFTLVAVSVDVTMLANAAKGMVEGVRR
jgi:2-dehydro-3-deoxyglucarate aldolase/4-hydroxy-2-oxoheptanedioate aldolase